MSAVTAPDLATLPKCDVCDCPVAPDRMGHWAHVGPDSPKYSGSWSHDSGLRMAQVDGDEWPLGLGVNLPKLRPWFAAPVSPDGDDPSHGVEQTGDRAVAARRRGRHQPASNGGVMRGDLVIEGILGELLYDIRRGKPTKGAERRAAMRQASAQDRIEAAAAKRARRRQRNINNAWRGGYGPKGHTVRGVKQQGSDG